MFFYHFFRDLTHNELVSVDKTTLTKLPKLKHLLLDHNKISYVEEGAFAHLPSLQILYALFFHFLLLLIIVYKFLTF